MSESSERVRVGVGVSENHSRKFVWGELARLHRLVDAWIPWRAVKFVNVQTAFRDLGPEPAIAPGGKIG